MIIILKRNANPEKVEILKQELEHKGFKLHLSREPRPPSSASSATPQRSMRTG